jgi:hypothetical protein
LGVDVVVVREVAVVASTKALTHDIACPRGRGAKVSLALQEALCMALAPASIPGSDETEESYKPDL